VKELEFSILHEWVVCKVQSDVIPATRAGMDESMLVHVQIHFVMIPVPNIFLELHMRAASHFHYEERRTNRVNLRYKVGRARAECLGPPTLPTYQILPNIIHTHWIIINMHIHCFELNYWLLLLFVHIHVSSMLRLTLGMKTLHLHLKILVKLTEDCNLVRIY
jgi:hypothetical protein